MAEVKITNDQYPSNSITKPSTTQQIEREKVDPVIKKGDAVIQKQTLGQKFKKMFLPGDIKDIKEYAINQVLIPGLKNGAITLLEIAFFGQVRRRNTPQQNYTYYSDINRSRQPSTPSISRSDRVTHNFQNITFTTAQAAEDVIGSLLDILDRNGYVTVANFYDLCGIQSDWASEDWGWRGFQKLEPRAIRDGYIIDVQQPVYLR